MKNKIRCGINLVLLAAVVFLAFGERGNAQKRDVWEYKIERFGMGVIDKPEHYLNKTGQDGWELVTVDNFETGGNVLVFKRKK